MLVGDNIPATAIANWILKRQLPQNIPKEYYSSTHKTMIDIQDMLQCLTLNIDPVVVTSMTFYSVHIDAIKEIADGFNLRAEKQSECLMKFKCLVQLNWLIIPTNAQLVERWVKDSNECAYTEKDEHFASMVSLCHSSTVFPYKHEARQLATTRTLKGNKHVASGKLGKRGGVALVYSW